MINIIASIIIILSGNYESDRPGVIVLDSYRDKLELSLCVEYNKAVRLAKLLQEYDNKNMRDRFNKSREMYLKLSDEYFKRYNIYFDLCRCK